ncbi:MAG: 30S ribosomal protein S2 [Alphaproteobacteria bacterium]
MALPTFSMRQLLEAGVHYGHSTRRWNPKMSSYIFGIRNGVHIIDLDQTVPMLYRAMEAMRDIVAGGGRVLFVGTKPQASDIIKEAAQRCGQHYINHRWLGGALTNWKTVNNSIKRLKEMDENVANGLPGMTKKESLGLQREFEKLDRAIGGIRGMGGIPDMIFVIDTNKEAIAIQEAKRLNIPVAAILDTNSDPSDVMYAIPGNDDAMRAITLYCDLMAGAVLDGLQAEMISSGVDIGDSLDPMSLEEIVDGEPEAAAQEVPAEAQVKASAPAKKAEPAKKVVPVKKAEPAKKASPKKELPQQEEAVAE